MGLSGSNMADRPIGRVGRILGGRSDRGEYWLAVVALVALNVVLNLTLRDLTLTSLISLPIWVVIASRRLHDFDRTGWWSLVPFGIGILLGFMVSVGVSISGAVVSLIHAGVAFSATMIIGLRPGTPGPNRFGEPVTGAD